MSFPHVAARRQRIAGRCGGRRGAGTGRGAGSRARGRRVLRVGSPSLRRRGRPPRVVGLSVPSLVQLVERALRVLLVRRLMTATAPSFTVRMSASAVRLILKRA